MNNLRLSINAERSLLSALHAIDDLNRQRISFDEFCAQAENLITTISAETTKWQSHYPLVDAKPESYFSELNLRNLSDSVSFVHHTQRLLTLTSNRVEMDPDQPPLKRLFVAIAKLKLAIRNIEMIEKQLRPATSSLDPAKISHQDIRTMKAATVEVYHT
jgi:regulator of sirC expression with transglutaminase-like and TPR domain